MANRKSSQNSDQPELPLDAEKVPAAEPNSDETQVAPETESLAVDSDGIDTPPTEKENTGTAPLEGHYRKWFLEYASYVILDRAVPHIADGLKPVQRRVLHTLWEMDDGRFHKVANVVGATMRFHPHGDASICAALVAIAQRGWLIEPQGNFGNHLTGDDAAASRYIEARLTPFAREVLFNPKTTPWQLSYDGRAKEPVTLPAKFPITVLEGAEGIAVGLATKILPHNFNDICRASINHLQGKTFRIFPDFRTGGIADFSEYNDGERGGKVKVRAKIEIRSKTLLAITELPFGTNTVSLIESILAANTKGKIKVKKVDDNTADRVEILVHLPPGSKPEKMIQQLYVFTNCQMSISPAACVIEGDKPHFIGIREILRRSVDRTLALLKLELEIRLGELEQQWHWDSLERIFIEERIYRRIEKSQTWEDVLKEIHEGLKPFVKDLKREVTDDDVVRLTDIRIKRISAYNRFKAEEQIKKIEEEVEAVKHDLKNLIPYAIKWFEKIQTKYGKGIKRRTSYDEIAQINAADVVATNQRLYVDRSEGFIGLNWRQHDFVKECTIMDSVFCIMRDGSLKVTKVADKVFMGKDIIHINIWPQDGDTNFYTMIYQDKASGKAFAKRFQIGGLSRDKLYPLVKSEGSKIVYFKVSPNEKSMPQNVHIGLDGRGGARIRELDFDLSKVPVSTRSAKGLTVTKWTIKSVKLID